MNTPDWQILRALLCDRLDDLTPEQRSADTLLFHRWLLPRQGWAIGPLACNSDGLPISCSITSLTLDGFDWASLLDDRARVQSTLTALAAKDLTPSTFLMRELLLAPQLAATLPTHSPPERVMAVTPKKGGGR